MGRAGLRVSKLPVNLFFPLDYEGVQTVKENSVSKFSCDTRTAKGLSAICRC